MQDDPDAPPITVADIDRAPDTALVTADDTQVSEEDVFAAFVRVSDENASFRLELEQIRAGTQTIQILDKLIEPMAKRAFGFMCAYCAVVALILILAGFSTGGFNLPEDVLKFLVGSTATTVIGLVGMVLTGIFVGARKPRKPD